MGTMAADISLAWVPLALQNLDGSSSAGNAAAGLGILATLVVMFLLPLFFLRARK